MTSTRVFVAGGALLLAFASLQLFAPDYLFHLGFPLDDSWIHAVYGRALAQSGMLAYNPGIPATGETSPLWAVIFALPHLFTANASIIVLSMKVIGLLLHIGTALLTLDVAVRLNATRLVAITSAGLVALHPDLLAASVSGMEVPLATFLALWTISEVLRGPSWRLALVSFLAPLGRPEVACVGVLFLTARALAGTQPRALRAGATLLAGSLASFVITALRNYSVTGRPLPATFYAKVGSRGISPFLIQWVGYHDLLGQFALVDSLWLLIPVTLWTLWLLLRPRWRPATDAEISNLSTAGALFMSGLGFFSISFALVVPFGQTAFYFQRYALPGLSLVLAALPLLLDAALRMLPIPHRLTVLRAAVAGALGIGVIGGIPARLYHLANDARNIDDVQVAEGRSLADSSPTHVVWAVDAGAIRYFGKAFVVDTMGLNSPDMLSADAPAFLQAHQPTYISFVNGWTDLDPTSRQRMNAAIFRPSTPYTVTGFQPQAVHYLTHCPDSPHSGRYAVFGRAFSFTCTGG
jgi:hypothetical protein